VTPWKPWRETPMIRKPRGSNVFRLGKLKKKRNELPKDQQEPQRFPLKNPGKSPFGKSRFVGTTHLGKKSDSFRGKNPIKLEPFSEVPGIEAVGSDIRWKPDGCSGGNNTGPQRERTRHRFRSDWSHRRMVSCSRLS